MKVKHQWQQCIQKLGWMLMMGASMSAFAETRWKEEVLLHDGSKIIVERSVIRGGRHEIGQRPPIKEQGLSFTVPGTIREITWEDKYSEDIGTAGFLPLLVGAMKDTAYVVASPMGCLSYNKWGRPNPPYVVWQYRDNKWMRITLQELPAELKVPNVVFSSPDDAAGRASDGVVSAATVSELNGSARQSEYKTILREPVADASGGCGEMVYDGHGGWVGVGWFKKQKTREACLKYCELEKIGEKYCPCETLFGGK